jgi:membrane dipeptidase
MKYLILASLFVLGCSSNELVKNQNRNPNQEQIDLDRIASEILNTSISIDAHNHVDVPLVSSELPGPFVDLKSDLTKSGLSTIAMTFAVDYQKLNFEGEAFDRFLNGLKAMDKIIEDNNISRALNYDDIKNAKSNKKLVVIQAVEGGHFLEGKIERLKLAYDLGLRHIGLLHDNDASTPLGDIYTNPPKWGGLTEFGKNIILESERLGILVDLTHADDNTIAMALNVAKKPMIVSHTGLNTRLGSNPKMASMMKPRLISSVTAKKIAVAGGLVCVWTHLSDNADEYAKNIRAMVDVMGIDHVCIGTDTKLTKPYRLPNFPQMGERVGERTSLVWQDQKDGFNHEVVKSLLKNNFEIDEIQKLIGGNYLRIFKLVTDN